MFNVALGDHSGTDNEKTRPSFLRAGMHLIVTLIIRPFNGAALNRAACLLTLLAWGHMAFGAQPPVPKLSEVTAQVRPQRINKIKLSPPKLKTFAEFKALSHADQVTYLAGLQILLGEISSRQKQDGVRFTDSAKNAKSTYENGRGSSNAVLFHDRRVFEALLGRWLAPAAQAADGGGSACVYAGWLQTTESDSKYCTPPPSDGCVAGSVQCNPLIFGDGVCTPKGVWATATCLKNSGPLDDIARKLSDKKADWDQFTSGLATYCGEGKQAAVCRMIKRRVAMLNASIAHTPAAPPVPLPATPPGAPVTPPHLAAPPAPAAPKVAKKPAPPWHRRHPRVDGEDAPPPPPLATGSTPPAAAPTTTPPAPPPARRTRRYGRRGRTRRQGGGGSGPQIAANGGQCDAELLLQNVIVPTDGDNGYVPFLTVEQAQWLLCQQNSRQELTAESAWVNSKRALVANSLAEAARLSGAARAHFYPAILDMQRNFENCLSVAASGENRGLTHRAQVSVTWDVNGEFGEIEGTDTEFNIDEINTSLALQGYQLCDVDILEPGPSSIPAGATGTQ